MRISVLSGSVEHTVRVKLEILQLLCRVFVPVFTDTRSVKIHPETLELRYKIVARFYRSVYTLHTHCSPNNDKNMTVHNISFRECFHCNFLQPRDSVIISRMETSQGPNYKKHLMIILGYDNDLRYVVRQLMIKLRCPKIAFCN